MKLNFFSLFSQQDDRFKTEEFENTYKVTMKLTITNVDIADFGMYKCLAKNSLGETDGSIKLYRKYQLQCNQLM